MNEREVFIAALQIESAAQRRAYLDAACGADEELRRGVEALLSVYERAGSFLEQPLADPAATADDAILEKPGTVIGPYKLMEQIGEGGMGLVFVAEQQQPVRRKVALKVIKPGMDTRQVVARFEAERQALALMDHPNIAKVHDGGTTENGRPYFVMELVKGVPITEYCDQNQLSIRQRLELFVSVCQAVQHAHQKGIIHRDLKPSNVMVMSHDGTPMVKVIDFGVAKAIGQQLTDKTIYTQFAQMVGTPLYMSPEQAGQSGLDVDTRSDIYSLGVLLYELLTGTTPFDREHLHSGDYDEIRRLICEQEPPRPSTRISTLGQAATTISTQRQSEPKQLSRLFRGELDWIVMKALEKERNRRYETANALARDVERYLADEPVEACPPSLAYRLRKLARRHRLALAVTGSILLFLASLGSVVGWAVRVRSAREEKMERDRAAREEALDQTIESSLNDAGVLIEQGKWPEALARVDRAEQLLAAAGRNERSSRLLDLQRELHMAQRLEDIYHEPKQLLLVQQQQRNSLEEDFLWGRRQDQQFAQAFREFGIDVEALGPSQAAAHIRDTSIRQALIQALDAWTAMRKRAKGDKDAFWKKLIDVARQADADPWRDRCREALLRRDRAGLEKLADEVPVRDVPPATVYMLGHALSELGALDKAMAVLREAHRHHPDDFWLNDALGFLSKDICRPSRYDDALRYYSMSTALRPQNWHMHINVAELLEKKGATEEAMAEYARAIELAPKNAQVWREQAGAYWRLHQYDKALDDLSKVIELDPKHAAAWNSRGAAYYDLHQYDKALADYAKAIELDPKHSDAWSNRGLVYKQLHQYDKALVYYSKAIELDPKHANALKGRCDVYVKLYQCDKLIADCSKIIELEPKFVRAWDNRGFAYLGLHQYDKALADCSKAIELDPKCANAWNNRGLAYHRLLQYDKALADYSESTKLDPKYVLSHNNLAWLLATCPTANLRDPRRAVELAKKAVELAPAAGSCWNTLGAAQYCAGDWKAAIQALKKSMDLGKGGNSFDWFFLAMAHRQLQQKDQARRWYDRAVQWMDKNDPKNDELRRFRSEAAELLGLEKERSNSR